MSEGIRAGGLVVEIVRTTAHVDIGLTVDPAVDVVVGPGKLELVLVEAWTRIAQSKDRRRTPSTRQTVGHGVGVDPEGIGTKDLPEKRPGRRVDRPQSARPNSGTGPRRDRSAVS